MPTPNLALFTLLLYQCKGHKEGDHFIVTSQLKIVCLKIVFFDAEKYFWLKREQAPNFKKFQVSRN